jgi:hypothetical protein
MPRPGRSPDHIDLMCETDIATHRAIRMCAKQVQESHPTLVRVRSVRTKLVTTFA